MASSHTHTNVISASRRTIDPFVEARFVGLVKGNYQFGKKQVSLTRLLAALVAVGYNVILLPSARFVTPKLVLVPDAKSALQHTDLVQRRNAYLLPFSSFLMAQNDKSLQSIADKLKVPRPASPQEMCLSGSLLYYSLFLPHSLLSYQLNHLGYRISDDCQQVAKMSRGVMVGDFNQSRINGSNVDHLTVFEFVQLQPRSVTKTLMHVFASVLQKVVDSHTKTAKTAKTSAVVAKSKSASSSSSKSKAGKAKKGSSKAKKGSSKAKSASAKGKSKSKGKSGSAKGKSKSGSKKGKSTKSNGRKASGKGEDEDEDEVDVAVLELDDDSSSDSSGSDSEDISDERVDYILA